MTFRTSYQARKLSLILLMKMADRGAMSQVGPQLCTPTVQSSIWLRSLALTRAQVEETMEGATGIEEQADKMTASSWQRLPGISAPSTHPSFFLPLPSSSSPHRTKWSAGGKQSPATSTWSLSDTHLLPLPHVCYPLVFELLPVLGPSASLNHD